MTDKLYNGFREGRAPGDHKPNNQVRGMTQETMTKEQILEKHAGGERMTFVYSSEALFSMEEYAQQQLSAERERLEGLIKNEPVSFFLVNIMRSLPNDKWPDLINALNERCSLPTAERERAGKLVEAVQSFVQASDDFNIGYINRNGEITRCGIAALSVAFNAAEKRLRIALTESNKP